MVIGKRNALSDACTYPSFQQTNWAIELVVGWSNRSVYGRSVANRSVSKLASSAPAIESTPDAIKGTLTAMFVPVTRTSIDEIISVIMCDVCGDAGLDSRGSTQNTIFSDFDHVGCISIW